MAKITNELFRKIRRIEIQASHLVEDILAGTYRSAFRGKGMEFEDVREYQHGDDIRTVDWNVTARMNHPYVKNFREERELTVMLVIDISASSRYGSGKRLKSEWMTEIGAVLAFSAIKSSDKVGLILFSDRVEKYVPPRKGVRHVLRVIREILAFEPEHKQTDIRSALTFLGEVQRRSTVCFLISDFIGSGYEHEISLIAKRHDLISIAITDPTEKDFPDMGLITIKDCETGEICLIDTSDAVTREQLSIQSNTEKFMQKIGAGYIEIRTDTSYLKPIKRFFQIRKRRRR